MHEQWSLYYYLFVNLPFINSGLVQIQNGMVYFLFLGEMLSQGIMI